MWAIFIIACCYPAIAQDTEFAFNTEPWSDQEFEICPVPNDDGLRAVLFKPEIEEWSYTLEVLPTIELKATRDGVIETVVSNKKQFPAYHLVEQKIGYLNEKNEWVDKYGNGIRDLDSFERISGEKVQPTATGSYESYAYKANLELENAAALSKIHYEAPCTVFSVGHFDKLESETHFDFGKNNPYGCGLEASFKRSQKFNYTSKTSRPVVSRPDGSQYYLKLPSGEIKTYGWTGIEYLYNDDGVFLCDWKDLGQFIGYELIQSPE